MIAAVFWGLFIVAALAWALAFYRKLSQAAITGAFSRPAQHESSSAAIACRDDDLFNNALVGLGQLALDGRIVKTNEKLQTLCGFDERQLTARFLPNLFHSDDGIAVNVVLSELASGNGDSRELKIRLLHSYGHTVYTQVAIRLVRGRGRPLYFIVALTDISAHALTEQIAQVEHAKFEAIAAQVPVAVWLLSPERQIVFVNDALEELVGRKKESFFVNPRSFLDLIHPADSDRVRAVIRNDSEGNYEINYRILRDDGELRYIRQLGKGIYDANGKLLYCIASAMDISSEMVVRDELHELNSRLRETNLCLRESVRLDGLTRCLNRVALFEEAEKALLLARRYQRTSTVVFFDLNNFKEINDSFGHHVGDRALLAFAEQIKARLRTTDELGRYGGDEFVALLRETDADQALQLLSTLAPVVLGNEDGSSIILRFSAGVASSDDEGIQSVDDWLRVADGLMYRQKMRVPKGGNGRG